MARGTRTAGRIGALVTAAVVSTLIAAFAGPADADHQLTGTRIDTVWHWPAVGLTGTGYAEITQLVTVESTTPDAGFYWAEQFWFNHTETPFGGYMGLQSAGLRRADGSVGDMALFSIWDGIDARGPACGIFYELGVGHSCSIAYDWEPGVPYEYRITRVGAELTGTWWQASVTDTTRGQTTVIGEIKVPPHWGALTSTSNFSEFFLTPSESCSDRAYSRVRFSTPSASGGSVRPSGHTTDPAEHTCPISWWDVPDGVAHEIGDISTAP